MISFAIGVAIIATVRRWPTATRKYQAARFTGADGSPVDGGTLDGAADAGSGAAVREPDSIGDWDALSDGADPTSR